MGTTMNAYIEVKHAGMWLLYANPAMKRDYDLFNLIAQVRDEAPIKSEIKYHAGLPKDLSLGTKLCSEELRGYGMRCPGWLDSEQIRTLQDELYKMRPDVKRTGIDELDLEHSIFHTYINKNSIAGHSGFEDSRLVFWFD